MPSKSFLRRHTYGLLASSVGLVGATYAQSGSGETLTPAKAGLAQVKNTRNVPAPASPTPAALATKTKPVKPMTGVALPPAAPPPPPAAPPPPPAPLPPIQVGTGVSDITGPIAEVVMMGYANSDQIAAGIQQRLHARAFVFSNLGKRVVFVSAELGQLFSSIKQGVIRRLAAKYGNLYNDSNVQIAATHTHAGPGGYSHHAIFNFTSYGFVPQNYEAIVSGITEAISQAHDSLGAATLRMDVGDVQQASINRSLVAFNANNDVRNSPATAPLNSVNPEMTVMRIDRASGPAGVIAWFAVHNTSLTRNNRLVSPDHKGYASYLFEKMQGTILPYQAPGKFVAAFPNSEEGDLSPNIAPNFKGPGSGTEYDAMRIIGEREFGAASNVFNAPNNTVRGEVDFRHTFVKMPGLLVATTQKNGAGQSTLCNGAYGFSFAAGAEDGPSGAPGFAEGMLFNQKAAAGWSNLATFFNGALVPTHLRQAFGAVSNTFNDTCQRPKPVLIPSSELGWAPDILPFQLLRVGNLAIAGVPGEMTVQAGRRLRAALLGSLRAKGILRVVTTGLANEYSGYVATPEEYDTQQYEGASTLYGRLTLEAYLQIFGQLAAAMVAQTPVGPGPTPPDLSANQISLQTGVVYDDKRLIETFGQVMTQPGAAVSRGGTVSVSFRAGHPKNDLKRNDSYFFVERKVSDIWATAAWDSTPEAKMVWRRDKAVDCLACSFADIIWNVPLDAIPGTYRIRHRGAWKNGVNGAIKAYEGTSREFAVR